MKRLAAVTVGGLAVLAACQDSSVQPPAQEEATNPNVSLDILDGRFDPDSGNPFFFFIPPLAPNASNTPSAPFNLTVNPTVEVCPLQATSSGTGKNTIWTPTLPLACQTDGDGNPILVAAFGPPYESPSSIDVAPGTMHYHVDWSPSKQLVNQFGPFYRISSKLGSTYTDGSFSDFAQVFTEFGYRDIEIGGSGSSSDLFAGFNGNVAIKFQLFEGAVCFDKTDSGSGQNLECGFGTIEANNQAGTVLADQGNALFAWEATATTGENVNIFILEKPFPCLPVDFPQYPAETELGKFCYELFSIPANPELNDAVEFGICPDVTDGSGNLLLFDQDQYNLIRGHRLADGLTATGDVEVLPPGSDPTPGAACDPFPAVNGSLGSKTFWTLAGGFLKTLVAPLRPEPLYASNTAFLESRTMSRFKCCSTLGYGQPASINGVDDQGTEVAGTPPTFPVVDLGVVTQGSPVDVVVTVKDAGTLLRDPLPVQGAVVRVLPDAGGTFAAAAGAGTPVVGDVGNPMPDPTGMSLNFQTGGILFPGTVAGSWTPGAAGVRFLTASGYGYGPVLADDIDPFVDPPVFLDGAQVGVQFKVLVCDATNVPTLDDGAVLVGSEGYTLIGQFNANVSGGSAIPSWVYATSDCENLYVAVVVSRDGSEKPNTLRIDYDDDRGAADEGRTLGDDWLEMLFASDGSFTLIDGFIDGSCFKGNGSLGKAACGATDAGEAGTDGRFTVQTDNSGNNAPGTAWVFETKKCLNCGSAGQDMGVAIESGAAVGIQILLRMGSGAHGGTLFPETLGQYVSASILP